MSDTQTTGPSELGVLAAESIGEFLQKAVGRSSIVSYVEGQSPLNWNALDDAGWTDVGVRENGEGATLRDLVEIARVWGESCIPLPFISTVMAKRHSAAARASDCAVTVAVATPTLGAGSAYIPFGQIPGIVVATGLGVGRDSVIEVPLGQQDALGLTLRGLEAEATSDFSAEAALEFAVVWASEAVGAARRLLDDSIAYASERKQFGKQIGSFQAVKHHLANALIAAELAESAVIWASLEPAEAFRGSLFAVDKSIEVAEIAIQVHGGLGFTWEVGLHFYLRHMIAIRELISGLRRAS